MLWKDKQNVLQARLRELGSVAIAFSGGVDSTYLLTVAHQVLPDQVIAITARSLSFPERELNEAMAFAQERDIEQIIVDSEELDIDGFSDNPPNRCYLCKQELFSKIVTLAKEKGFSHVLDGSNADDHMDYRPGHQAAVELGVVSPLDEAGFTKDDIRQASQALGLPTWDKQSFACLASRFAYGELITPERLSQIDRAEQFLLDSGFSQVRVRYHGNLARIETDAAGQLLLHDRGLCERIYDAFREYGFDYVAADLLGYRTGSMNETLPE